MKHLYKPFGLLVGVIGGLAAATVFSRLWGAIGTDGELPSPTDRYASWREIMVASAMRGAVVGVR